MEKKDLDNLLNSNTIVYTITWSPTKSARLKRVRGVSFEEIIQGDLVDIRSHPQRENQSIFVYEYNGYIWAVPFVVDDERIFLKTIYPSRKFFKLYRKERNYEKD